MTATETIRHDEDCMRVTDAKCISSVLASAIVIIVQNYQVKMIDAKQMVDQIFDQCLAAFLNSERFR